jgi:hypothetical protein
MATVQPRATTVIHVRKWAGWPNGEPQSVREAADAAAAKKQADR